MKTLKIQKDIREENLRTAAALSEYYKRHSLRVVGVLGAPGSGKTTLLENLLPRLMLRTRVAVIEGDLATDNDAKRIEKTGAKAVQINTNGACHLDAKMVGKALAGLDLEALDLLFIENVGNLVCPVGFPLGEDIR
ncbi:MAG TPA: hydrogenase nickel incorporation protein HypB, partial [Clostridia bacterium]|nr:hydrogenase nickel incorporation protein HypB [Clostridia bacterium]